MSKERGPAWREDERVIQLDNDEGVRGGLGPE
jgi:hypothetical protein